jgi:hypothetical protein
MLNDLNKMFDLTLHVCNIFLESLNLRVLGLHEEIIVIFLVLHDARVLIVDFLTLVNIHQLLV